jgi:hypothetical protein
LAVKICEAIKDEITIIDELKKLSLSIKHVVIQRNLNALNENNGIKKVVLLKMVSLQRKKDALISKLAMELGLSTDSSVKDILGSNVLDNNSQKLLKDKSRLLEREIEALSSINAMASLILLNSYKLNNASIDIFRTHGTLDNTYSKNVTVKASKRHSKINKRI